MTLGSIPPVGPRYWFAMAIASMCGANLGDIIMDVLKLQVDWGLALLMLLFCLLLVMERVISGVREMFYWGAILIVRATATNIADFAIKGVHLTYAGASVFLALILLGLILLDRRQKPIKQGGSMNSADGKYWFCMLIAGTLGTLIADGLGHAFGPVQIGVPIAAAIGTLAMLAIFFFRSRKADSGVASYWIALVCIRWWGTSVGDISAYLLSILVSTALTAAALTVLLFFWPLQWRSVAEIQAK